MCSRRPLATSLLLSLILLAPAVPRAQTDVYPELWVTDARVDGMAVLGDTLFVSGRFGRVGPPTGQLAVLDKQTGEPDLSLPRFDGLTAIGSPGVMTVVLDGQGGYYVGGDLRFADGTGYNLAHVLADGTLDPDFRPNPILDTEPRPGGRVSTLLLDGGVLYVGGEFDIVGGQPRQNLAALDAATGEVLPLSVTFTHSSSSYRPFVHDLSLSEGILYIGGTFTSVSGQPRVGLVALDVSMGAVLPWRADLARKNPNFLANAFDLADTDSTLYLGGVFDFVAGQPRDGIAEVTLADPVSGEGGVPTPWAPSTGAPDFVVTAEYLWGASSYSGGAPLARISRETGAVTTFPVASGLRSGRSIAYDPVGGVSGQGTLYLGCQRLVGSGSYYPAVVGVDPATGQATGYEVLGGTDGNYVGALAVEPGSGGHLFAGGTFVTLGAGVVRRQGLAAFDLSTGRPTPFAEDVSDPNQGLHEDLALSPDGRFLYGYSNVLGGVVLRLTEYDLVTGAVREFIPNGLTAADLAASVRPGTGGGDSGASGSTTRPPGGAAPSPSASTTGGAYVTNAANAIVVTEERVCISVNGVACYDRTTTEALFYTPMLYVGTISENEGDLLYLPPDGPVDGPGGPAGTLYLAAPVEEAPVGEVRPAFVAVDVETGAVIEEWDVGFGGDRGPEGYTLALLDVDGEMGPSAPALYLGGDREWFDVQGEYRRELMAVDPLTAELLPWAPEVSGGPVLAMAAHRRAVPEDGGVVYVGGAFTFVNGQRVRYGSAGFDAETAALLDWNPEQAGPVLVMLLSERHGALFLGGIFGNALRGTGHAHVVAVTPAAPIITTSGEPPVPETPASAALSAAYPNPFTGTSALGLTVPKAQRVEVALFDVLGRRVAVLHEGPLQAGAHRIEVDGSSLPSGVYVVRASGETFGASRRVTVVR